MTAGTVRPELRSVGQLFTGLTFSLFVGLEFLSRLNPHLVRPYLPPALLLGLALVGALTLSQSAQPGSDPVFRFTRPWRWLVGLASVLTLISLWPALVKAGLPVSLGLVPAGLVFFLGWLTGRQLSGSANRH